MYQLRYDDRVYKDFRGIPSHLIEKILGKVQQLKENPRSPSVEKLKGDVGYRLRVGDYRVLFMIDDKGRWVTVYRVRHRKEAYR